MYSAVRRAALALILSFPAGAQRKPFAADDLWLWRNIQEARISPDGKQVAYIETVGDRESESTRSHLWLASSDGRERRALTEGPWRDSSPRWSADGALIGYISDRSGRRQITIRKVASGEQKTVGIADQEPLAFAWSPDGNSIVFTALASSEAARGESWAPAEALKMLYPPATRRVQLFIVQVSGGATRRLTTGDLNWRGEPVWLATGQSIICEGAPDLDPEHPLEGGQLFAIRPADGATKQLTDRAGGATHPTASPDGSRIAWLATGPAKPDAPAQSYWPTTLFVMNPDGSRVKQLSGTLDRDVFDPQWSSDSRTVYFLAEDNGASRLYAGRNDGTSRPLTKGNDRLKGFSLADNGRTAALRSNANEAGDLISFSSDLPAGVTTLAAPNEHLLADRNIGAVEEIHYESAGRKIQGWLVKPPDFDPARKYPLLLDIQDSPRAMYGYEFQLRAQVFSAAGYIVLLINPAGSPGYGEQFGNLLRTRFPGDDADDLVRGLDFAISRGAVDPNRLVVAGGLVAAWLIGHTERFQAAVLRRPIADWLTNVSHSADGLHRAASWMGTMPWEDTDQYVKHSPVYFAQNFHTPSLIIGPAHDPDCEELYFALKARKAESAWLQTPPHKTIGTEALEWMTEIQWLRKNLQK